MSNIQAYHALLQAQEERELWLSELGPWMDNARELARSGDVYAQALSGAIKIGEEAMNTWREDLIKIRQDIRELEEGFQHYV